MTKIPNRTPIRLRARAALLPLWSDWASNNVALASAACHDAVSVPLGGRPSLAAARGAGLASKARALIKHDHILLGAA